MSLPQLFFYAIGALTLVSALGVVVFRSVVYCTLSLLVSLLAVAGLYILLFAEFIALVQVLLYGGAITILVLLALMLTPLRRGPPALDNPQRLLALLASLAAFAVLGITVAITKWGTPVAEPDIVKLTDLGNTLFSQWVIPFEVASLILLVALIGAIIIAREADDQ